jgi:phenylalanyl-tRNA synthetase beta chain
MNILIPDSWLREHLASKANKAEIQKYLSLSGPAVERIYNDEVYDIEVTTNRVDSMSVRGIAREAATILKRAGIAADLKTVSFPVIQKHPQKNLALPEIIYETESVRRVLAIVLTDLQDAPSPAFMQTRLEAININVHGALIDISNYITHELGHPCHVFDYDKIMNKGGKIIIKEASKGKKFVTLDEVEHETVGGEIVFESVDGEIIDLPAVKGTLNTGVDHQTKSILFWIESLDAKKVRYASMSHAIRTVAAQLNEKNVDPHLAQEVMAYGVQLFSKLCQAKVASELYDYFPVPVIPKPVTVKLTTIDNYLGIKLQKNEIKTILTDLDCQVVINDEEVVVTPPTFRPDIQIPADVVEELARIYGYHNLPSQLMDGALAINPDPGTDYQVENLIKHFLADLGWQEIYSYSLVSEQQALDAGYKLAEHLKLANPLKEENAYLRRSLIPSLLEVFTNNPNQKELSVFEIAKLYHPQVDDLPEQSLTLSLLSNRDYRLVKGDLDSLFKRLYLFTENQKLLVQEKVGKEAKHPLATQIAELVLAKDKKQSKLGKIMILKTGLVAIELDLTSLISVSHKYPRYQKLIKTAAIIEEMTFTLPKQVAVGEFMESLQKVDARLKKVELLDIYKDNYSFSFIFQDKKVNISNEEVEPIRQKIAHTAQNEFKARLVGKI